MIKAYKCKYLDDNDYPSSECINCWREAAQEAIAEEEAKIKESQPDA